MALSFLIKPPPLVAGDPSVTVAALPLATAPGELLDSADEFRTVFGGSPATGVIGWPPLIRDTMASASRDSSPSGRNGLSHPDSLL